MRFPRLPGVTYFTQTVRHHSISAALLGLTYRFARLFVDVRVCHLLGIDIADLVVDETKLTAYEHRLLTADDIRSIAADPAYDLEPFMADRVADGDAICFGVFDGPRLVNYSWYTLNAVDADDTLGMKMSFSDDTAYIFKVFTHPDYRGRRIHSLAVLRAFEELSARGLRRVVGIIEFANWPSVRSHVRLGGKKLAYLVTIGRGPDRVEWFPPRLAAQGLRLGRDAVLIEPTTMNV
jgi:GNAT superfamily N-acetyltransferase